jgi:16S rRNA processing protein RimM
VTETVRVGRVGRPHGLEGAFVVDDASDDPGRFAVGARLLVDGDPAEVVESKRAGGRLIVRLDREAERGAELCVSRAELAAPGEDEYYVFQLVGLPVEEDGGRILGRVQEVAPGVANDVLELDTGVALPVVEDCVLSVDLERGRILVAQGFAEHD